jgi:hypothetical protein
MRHKASILSSSDRSATSKLVSDAVMSAVDGDMLDEGPAISHMISSGKDIARASAIIVLSSLVMMYAVIFFVWNVDCLRPGFCI